MKILIFSGYNPRAIISFCRIASEYNLNFDIIAKSKDDEILKTDYKSNVVLIRKSTELNITIIFDIIKKYNNTKLFILPSTEYLNRILLYNKFELNNKNVFFGLTNFVTYNSVSDKLSFSNICNTYEIKTPIEYNFNFKKIPYVIKPKKYFNKDMSIDTPMLVFDESTFDEFFSNKNPNDFYLQEFVSGESIYFLFYFSKNGEFDVFSQKNYIQQPNGGSITYAKSSEHYKESITNKLVTMFRSINFFGLVMVEFRKRNDEWIMIEANPRLWGPSQLILDSGMNLFDKFLYDNNLISSPKSRIFKPNISYVWEFGMTDNDTYHYGCSDFNYDAKSDIYNRTDTIQLYE
jgi:predicted ATP-grasp superfamily ATP-dependent carboligase